MLARHLLRSRAGGAGAGCVPRRCYSSEQWSRLESKASGIVQGLEQQGQTVGVAELASGGLISAGNCRHSNLSPPHPPHTLTLVSSHTLPSDPDPDPGPNPNPNPDPNQLYTSGVETEPEFAITQCGSTLDTERTCSYERLKHMKTKWVPSLSYAGHYPAVKKFFAEKGITTHGFIEWATPKGTED